MKPQISQKANLLNCANLKDMPQPSKNAEPKGTILWFRKHWLNLSLLVFFVCELLVFLVPVFSEYNVWDQSVHVDAFDSTFLSFSSPNGLGASLRGSFNVSDDEAISVLVLDGGAFTNWRNHRNATSLLSVDQTTFGRVDVPLKENENYRMIFDNSFSSMNKSISVYLTITFIPTFYGVPVAYVYRLIPILPLSLLVVLNICFSSKDRTEIVPKGTLYLLVCFVAVLGVATTLSPPASVSEAFSRTAIITDSVVAFVSIFVSITALRISHESGKVSEKMMKVQLVYNDRKRVLEKLISILDEKGYGDLTKKYWEFVSSVDWLYIPEEMRRKINGEIAELISFYHDSNPEGPAYSEEEIDAMTQEYDEQRAEEYEEMDGYERFRYDLDEKMKGTRTNVEQIIKDYLSELSK